MQRQSREEMLAENRERIARVCEEIIGDVRRGESDAKLEINLTFMERLLSQRRQIRWHGHGGRGG
jgi:hypothetical protein